MAVTQTLWAIDRIKELNPNLEVEHKIVKTTGDLDQKTRLDKFAGLGVFVKELQIALMDKEIDVAVHSLKDVPENQPEDLALVCFPEREDSRDVWIGNGKKFMDLPKGSKVGTGSPRRIVQLQQLRDDLEYIAIRGNLDTRINKVESGELAGIILAAAGMKRLGMADKISSKFSFDSLIPAIGQGALALECRRLDTESIALVKSINDPITEACVLMERQFMAEVGGGCKVPMACHIYSNGEAFRMAALIGDLKKKEVVRLEREADHDDLEQLLRSVSDDMMAECKDRDIPLPKDLPEHALLEPDK